MTLSTPPSLKLRHLWPVADRVEYARRRQPAVRASRPPLGDWLRRVSPRLDWTPPHLVYLQRELEKVASGETKRLIVSMPPRHGKTQLVTVRFPVYMLAHNSAMRVIVGAYNQTLVNKFSRMARRVAESAGVALAHDRQAVEEWETTKDGGLRAVGVGGGITGQGGDLIIIDDPVKNREEAESLAFRERVWDWYTNDLYTRLEPDGAIILIMTRWHGDDLAGRILASEDADQWRVVSLPALAEEEDPLRRAEGEPLWAARFDRAALAGIKQVLGPYGFAALYQQRPAPREGGMFKRAWVQIAPAAPAEVTGRVRYWDTGATAGGGDYTAGTLVSRTADGRVYIEDIVRGQWDSGERRRVQRATAELDGTGVQQWQQQEPGSGGKDQARDFVTLMAGFPAYTEPATGSKEIRADPFAAQFAVGNVWLVKGAWNPAFIDELTSFPNGANDDQVETAAGGFNRLTTASQGVWL